MSRGSATHNPSTTQLATNTSLLSGTSFLSGTKPHSKFLCLGSLALALLLLSLVLGNMHRGFDLSDEGMHLSSILHPEYLLAAPSDFGNFLHPLFMALGQDVYLLRMVTLGLLCATALLFAFSHMLFWSRHTRHNSPWIFLGMGGTLLAASLSYYVNWNPTPNYNYLALIGVLNALSALALYATSQNPAPALRPLRSLWARAWLHHAALVLLGIAGFIAFVGKGTTGVGMALVSLVFVLCSGGPRSLRQRFTDALLAGSLALALLCLYLLCFSDGWQAIQRILLCTSFMDNSYGITQSLHHYFAYIFPLNYRTVLALYPLWAMVLWATHTQRPRTAICTTAFILGCMLFFAQYQTTNTIISLCAWPLFCATTAAAIFWRRSWRHFFSACGKVALLAAALICYHAGTNTGMAFKATEAFILTCSAILCLACSLRTPQRTVLLPAVALLLCCMAYGTLAHAFITTHRHNGVALWQMNARLDLRPGTTPLLVHPERQAFIHWLRSTATAHGWQVGTPLLNTSYYATAAYFLLEARNTAASWQLEARLTPVENYPRIFGQISPQSLHKAWILKPVTDSPRHMPAAELSKMGLPFPEGYELLGQSPKESHAGVWPAMAYELWKPRQSAQ